ncbi:LysR substrate-binding domain-containing protein [Caenimonas soli]|uniref:LysR substrate-binding domain-containing protein n=1 Tax=Caenimonas soli TaxID=2735555 RepID=UPI001556DA2B|nr:LysR substrate-binding domain-containing protein [Caenimonas soli]NPC59136.1 LysR family transcriptional regulator [Caenimonas soli]
MSTLLAFEAVADLGSFSKAGEALAFTHSAVSHQIRQLEEHLGVRLLQRLPTGVVLTPEGAVYLAEVKVALKRLESAEMLLKEHAATRPLRISVLASFASSMVVPELLSFLQQNPTVHIEIDARAGIENDEQADVDVFIRYGKGEWPNFDSVKLLDVELFPVCSPEFHINHGPFTHIRDLSRVVLLRHTMEPWEGWLKAVGADLADGGDGIIPAGPLFTDARLMLEAACDGQGVALARDVLAEKSLREGRLVRLFQMRVPSPQGYYAYFRPGAISRASVRLFLDWLEETCKRLQIHQ